MPVLLHCVSAYPTPLSGVGIGCIPRMQARFSCPVGLSDHTIGNEAGILAAGAGARIIEKHLTLDRRRGGPDDGFASGPGEFRDFCLAVKMAHEACSLQTAAEETAHAGLRRSLYIVQDVEAGERVTRDNVRSIRPGNGLHPKHLPTVLGKVFKRGAQGGTPLSLDFVE
jgi:N-acetylneuraminate synthase